MPKIVQFQTIVSRNQGESVGLVYTDFLLDDGRLFRNMATRDGDGWIEVTNNAPWREGKKKG